MTIALTCTIAAALGYFLGSLNFAIISGYLLKGKDIRNFGSGNAGLTNTLRCFGKECAILTLVGDLGKGMLAVFLSQTFGKMIAGADTDLYLLGCVAGLFAMLGHMFPVYYGFKGGKGVLVGVSIFLILDIRIFLVLIAIFAIMVAITKYVSMGSIVATACCPVVTFIFQCTVDFAKQQYTITQIIIHCAVLAVMCGMIIFMHRSNIRRLREGTESKIFEKEKKKAKPRNRYR